MREEYGRNKKARHDYEILDTLEAGLVLTGAEVKSIRNRSANLSQGYVTFHRGRPYLINVHISRYPYAREVGNDPERSRQLLLKKREQDWLMGKSQEKGLTILPLALYTRGRRIKLEIGVAKGKKRYDKRRVLKEREQEREVRRVFKRG